MRLLDIVMSLRPSGTTAPTGPALPDPAIPPGNRGEWGAAALTNVEITELVKRQLRTNTTPQQK